jgi:lsr operon transcriptional repressor
VSAQEGREELSPDELVLRAAWFYYKDELTQDEISKLLSISRASVGRLLDRARKIGVVRIDLDTQFFDSMELGSTLRETFGLDGALVVPSYAGEDRNQHAVNVRVGRGGAQYLSTHLKRGSKLGIGFGETVSEVVAGTNFGAGGIHLVTLTGGVDGYLHPVMSRNERDGDPLTAAVIPSPIVTSTAVLAGALRAEPTIDRVLAQARKVDLALVGVGTPALDATIVEMGSIDREDATALQEHGAVGDILGQFFDAHGNVVDLPLHERRIGIELEELRRVPTVIGVAGGLHKTDAILGALRGGYLDVLVTDEAVATRLLELAGARVG